MMNRVELNETELKSIVGGSSLKESPEYYQIKEFYINKGINSAILLALSYFDKNDARTMIDMIREEIEAEKFEDPTFF